MNTSQVTLAGPEARFLAGVNCAPAGAPFVEDGYNASIGAGFWAFDESPYSVPEVVEFKLDTGGGELPVEVLVVVELAV